MIDWLRNIPAYTNLNEVARDMNEAVKVDREEYEMCERDKVLAGLACYLAQHYTIEPIREAALQIIDTYCGKPVEQKDEDRA